MGSTARLALPLLSAGQAQKEIYHNEALQLLDMLAAAAVEELPLATPPANPAIGACYIVADAATGPWATKDHCLACFTGGGWRFVEPSDGLAAFVRSEGLWGAYIGGWEFGSVRAVSVVVGGQQVVGSRASAIASPAGGTTIDSEARTAIGQILSALRSHGLIDT
ncbi:MAG TPA: DUF2793 domain-containing protein [Sphingomicrobium sp.]